MDCDNGKTPCCQKPDNLKGNCANCTPEQIRTCHGEGMVHPCMGKEERKEREA